MTKPPSGPSRQSPKKRLISQDPNTRPPRPNSNRKTNKKNANINAAYDGNPKEVINTENSDVVRSALLSTKALSNDTTKTTAIAYSQGSRNYSSAGTASRSLHATHRRIAKEDLEVSNRSGTKIERQAQLFHPQAMENMNAIGASLKERGEERKMLEALVENLAIQLRQTKEHTEQLGFGNATLHKEIQQMDRRRSKAQGSTIVVSKEKETLLREVAELNADCEIYKANCAHLREALDREKRVKAEMRSFATQLQTELGITQKERDAYRFETKVASRKLQVISGKVMQLSHKREEFKSHVNQSLLSGM